MRSGSWCVTGLLAALAVLQVIALVVASVSAGSFKITPPEWFECGLYTQPIFKPNTTKTASTMAEFLSSESFTSMPGSKEIKMALAQRIVEKATAGMRSGAFKARRMPTLDPEFDPLELMAILGDTPAPVGNPVAECAFYSMPHLHDDPSYRAGETVPVFVKRFSPSGRQYNTPKAMILLQGGPGGSAEALDMLSFIMSLVLPEDFVFYSMEHRGVGRSRRLTCSGPQAETPGSDGGTSITDAEAVTCAQWLGDVSDKSEQFLSVYSTSQAARDLGAIIEDMNTMHPQGVVTYGVSYGTYLVNRYLEFFPNQSRLAIVDGVVATQGPSGKRLSFFWWDRFQSMVGLDLISFCQADPFCQFKLQIQGTPEQYIKQLYAKLSTPSNPCGALIGHDRNVVKSTLAGFLYSMETHPLFTMLLHRLNRCDARDQGVLKHFINYLQQSAPGNPTCEPLFSNMLLYHIGFTELVDYAPDYVPTTAQLTDIYNNQVLIGDGASVHDAEVYYASDWPVYPRPPQFNHTSDPQNTPLLLLNGDVDPQTSRYSARVQNETLMALYPNRKIFYEEIHGAVHGTIFRSPRSTGSKWPCGLDLIASFASSGDGSYDRTCMDTLIPIDFRGTDIVPSVQLMFGTSDGYDGSVAEKKNGDGGSGGSSSGSKKVSAGLFAGFVVTLSLLVVGLAAYVVILRRQVKSVGSVAQLNDGLSDGRYRTF